MTKSAPPFPVAPPSVRAVRRQVIHGFFAGALLVAGLFNLSIGVPLLLVYLGATSRLVGLGRGSAVILALFAAKFAWVTGVDLVCRQLNLHNYAVAIAPDVLLVALMLIRRDEPFLRGASIPALGLFAVDFLFNVWALLTGSDPLGRAPALRPDDVLARLGGVFNHPFYSINISTVAILLCLYLWERKLCRVILVLAVLNILANGSMRGAVMIAVLGTIYFLARWRARFGTFVGVGLVMAAGVFAATVFSTRFLNEESGNRYRVFAWKNALEVIAQNPATGYHHFYGGELPAVNEQSIVELGIAESSYLDYGIHYGLPAILLHLAINLALLARGTARVQRGRSVISSLDLVTAVFAGTVFVDTFYGTFYGSVFTTFYYAFLQFTVMAPPAAASPPHVPA